MCTVSFIPNKEGYVLTSNRDESPGRKTIVPKWWTPENGSPFMAPKDKAHQGTWIASGSDGRSACLLNGGFYKHHRVLPYRMSRGALIPMAFEAGSFHEFAANVNVSGVEPFTLILIDEFLQVLRWDGKRTVLQFLSKQLPHLWSSATLYSSEQHLEKERRLERFLKENSHPGPKDILELHGFGGENNFTIKREGVQTVSLTQVIVNGDGGFMKYLQPAHLFDSV